ncbi:fumarylacetoacetate hydrolase family protein [Pyrenochaeta sp. DS3sAY3a]|nr:fumarylacetoacetate hydrolase family protein [Pyrenochaeta sp. DS3sAY3a]
MSTNFQRLVRFKSPNGDTFYGELGTGPEATHDSLIGLKVPVYEVSSILDGNLLVTDGRVEIIHEVLCPLPAVPLFQCVGINYKTHIGESGLSAGKYPVIFTKPPDALAGPFDDIPINDACEMMDYEAELCFIIGKDCKDVKDRKEALSCIFGYTCGNDVSSRFWQMPERSGNQHGSAKSFDKFAPLGPTILHPTLMDEEAGLRIRTFVNGEVRQDARTNDLVFDSADIICHLTRGTTLRKGTVVMTGTPGGVAAFMKPPQWLSDGDIVEVDIEGIGRMRNKMKWEK